MYFEGPHKFIHCLVPVISAKLYDRYLPHFSNLTFKNASWNHKFPQNLRAKHVLLSAYVHKYTCFCCNRCRGNSRWDAMDPYMDPNCWNDNIYPHFRGKSEETGRTGSASKVRKYMTSVSHFTVFWPPAERIHSQISMPEKLFEDQKVALGQK